MRGDARQLGRGLLDEFRGACTLILTSPPYGHSTHGHVRKHADRVEKLNTRYSDNPNNLAHLPDRPGPRTSRPDFDSVVSEILTGCTRMLDPKQGRLVLTVRPYRQQGALVDLPGRLIKLAEAQMESPRCSWPRPCSTPPSGCSRTRAACCSKPPPKA